MNAPIWLDRCGHLKKPSVAANHEGFLSRRADILRPQVSSNPSLAILNRQIRFLAARFSEIRQTLTETKLREISVTISKTRLLGHIFIGRKKRN